MNVYICTHVYISVSLFITYMTIYLYILIYLSGSVCASLSFSLSFSLSLSYKLIIDVGEYGWLYRYKPSRISKFYKPHLLYSTRYPVVKQSTSILSQNVDMIKHFAQNVDMIKLYTGISFIRHPLSLTL